MNTLADVLLDKPKNGKAQIKKLLDKHLATTLRLTPGPARVTDQIADSIIGLLGLPLRDLLANAWEAQSAVRDACVATAHRPGSRTTVAVAQHTLENIQQSQVLLDVAGQQTLLCTLVLRLTLHIEAVTLTVAEGHVTGVGPSTATAAAELAVTLPVGGSVTLLSRRAPRLSLEPYHRPGAPLTVRAAWAEADGRPANSRAGD
jgi:hypothetical protein